MSSQEEMVRRLARACARGHRQMGFVNELLAGQGYREFDTYDHLLYGDTKMAHNSWNSLKTRLINNGFIIRQGSQPPATRFDRKSPKRQVIEMRFSA